MDIKTLKKLRELLVLKDEKSILLAKKIDSLPDRINEATDRFIKSIPKLNDPIIIDQTAKLEEIKRELQQPIKIKATLKIK